MNFRMLALAAAVAAALCGCGKTDTAAAVPASPPAISRDQPANAAPLGLEIGFANIAGVKSKIGSTAKLEDKGINQYSGGPMLLSDGQGLGLEGVTSALFIFDKAGTLAGLVMAMPKDPKDMLEKLSGKYSVVDNRIDTFMNNGYARLEKGDSFVEIDAPHLDFSMEVRYLTKQLMADFQKQRSEAEANKRQEQTNKL